jgi:hypothetical protein
MKYFIFKTLSYTALAITLLAPVLVWQGLLDPDLNKGILAAAMLLWFGTAPWWMNIEKPGPRDRAQAGPADKGSL